MHPREGQRIPPLPGHGVQDAPAEAAFEEITRLAARMLRVPAAYLGLLERDHDRERIVCKARIGLEPALLPGVQVFCELAARSQQVSVVPDAHLDARFVGTSAGAATRTARFYAGAPLLAPDGHVLGTLAVLDESPRSFDARDCEALAMFARQAVAQLELRRQSTAYARTLGQLRAERDRLQQTARQLETSEMRMHLVLKGTDDAWWDWNLATGEQYYSPRGWEMLGYPDQALAYDDSLWESLIHPEDRSLGQRMLAEAIEGGAERYAFELRMRHRNGRSIPVLCRGYILRDAQGRAVRVSGTDTDLTDRRQAEQALRAEQELNRQVFASALVGIAVYDAEGNCVAANAALTRQIGANSIDEVCAQNFHRIESWKTSGLYDLALHTQRTGTPNAKVVHVRTTFGRDLWQMASFSLLDAGGTKRLMLMADDLTGFKRAEMERNAIQQSYEMIFTNSLDGVLRTAPDGRVFAANPAACAMLGMTEEELCRRGRHGLLDPGDPRLRLLLEERERTGRVRGEVAMLRGNGERFEAELSSFVYRDSEGSELAGVMFRDITERKRAEADTHRLAYFDALTGLPNRRLLLDRIAQSLAVARRNGQRGALLFLDLDNFKRINDARGHSVGDSLLAQVAQRLTGMLRSVDMVARLGGDEFVVLVNDLGSDPESAARGAMLVAEKLRQILESPYLIDGYPYSGTGSVGVTMFPKGRDRVDDLLREADTAMYRAKESGRNRIAYFETAMQAEVEERFALEHDLQAAIDAGRIDVHVQPQFDAAGRETGGELLLRWNHPRRGGVSPAQFIPVAEDSGLILRLGELVTARACEALARLQAAGSELTLSVNVSPRQFRQDDFVERMRALLDSSGVRASGLVFEVTEGLLIDRWEEVASRMAALAAMGFRFSIDDFGTGYSSLAYLKRLPLHELKIDRSFVEDTPDDPNDTAIVESILSVARHLKLRVVAEGVETRAQADFLIASRCDGLQGFFFARPMPLDAWLAQRLAGTGPQSASIPAPIPAPLPASIPNPACEDSACP